jgi:hypothetical protein
MRAISQVIGSLLFAAAAGILVAIFASIYLPLIPILTPYEPRATAQVTSVSYVGNLAVLMIAVQIYAPAHGNVYISEIRGVYTVSSTQYQLTPAINCGTIVAELCSGPIPSSSIVVPVILRSSGTIQSGGEGVINIVFKYGSGSFMASATFKI